MRKCAKTDKVWESVQKLISNRKCAKSWESGRKCAKSWESVPRSEKVCQKLRKCAKSFRKCDKNWGSIAYCCQKQILSNNIW